MCYFDGLHYRKKHLKYVEHLNILVTMKSWSKMILVIMFDMFDITDKYVNFVYKASPV